MVENCTCFNNPPCWRCLESYICVFCDKLEHPDQGGELFEGGQGYGDEFMCGSCVAEVEREDTLEFWAGQARWDALTESQKDAAIRDALRVA